MERKYRLIPAKWSKYTLKDNLHAVEYGKPNLKDQLRNVIKPVIENYRFQSLNEYKAALSLFNVTLEEVRVKHEDRTERGIMYFALGKDGQKAGPPFKSSLFGKYAGNKALFRKYKSSKEWFSKNPVPEMTRE